MSSNKQQIYKHFKINTNTRLPFSIKYQSKNPGPDTMVVGAVHGSEHLTIEAVESVITEIENNQLEILKGSVTFVLGNPKAYMQGERFIEENLNRCFVENITNSLEGKRAQEFREYFQTNKIDYLLDLHSLSSDNLEIAIFKKPERREVALIIGDSPIHFEFPENLGLNKMLIDEVERLGGVGFAFENGNNHNPETKENAIKHIKSLLSYTKQIEKQFLPKKSKFVERYIAVGMIKPTPGMYFLNKNISTGTRVKPGETYAISDSQEYINNYEEDIFIIMPAKKIDSRDTDAGFLCRKEVLKIV